jgi:hypothetical protein
LHNIPSGIEGNQLCCFTINFFSNQLFVLLFNFKDPPGKISSLVRGCEEKPILFDEVLDDAIYRTHYRSCTTDLCNDGDGTRSSTEINVLSPDSDIGDNLLVPGLPLDNKAVGKRLNMTLHLVLICLGVILR